MRPAALLVVAALAVTGCESTQTKSARLEKEGAGKAQVGTVKAGVANPDVKVADTTILSGKDGAHAVVLTLDDRGAPQAAVPIQIVAKDAKGAQLYKNDLQGLQPSLQQMAFLSKGEKAYWVHDQVLASTDPKTVDTTVGVSKAPKPADVPKVEIRDTKLDTDPASGTFATGTVHNLSKVPQVNLPIYAVALKRGKVVAAGRAIIDRLNPEPQKKPVIFRIFFVGDPKGAELDVRAVPSTFTPGA